MSSVYNRTILLVEDEVLIAAVEQSILEKYGYQVITVETGEVAIETVNSNPDIDLILMDINLSNGIEGTKAAEIILKKFDLPLIFLSSHTEREIVEKTEGITSYGYIVKDSGETVLIASINMAFRLFDAKKKEKEKEKALFESEKKYRLLATNIPDIIYSLDNEARITAINKAALERYGYRDINFVGKQFIDYIHPEDRENVLNSFKETFATKREFTNGLRFRIISKSPGDHWLELNALSHFDKHGNYIGENGVLRDITDRKLVEDALIKHNRFLQAFNNYVIELPYVQYDTLFHFITNNLKNIFNVKAAWIGEYDNTTSSLILKGWSSTESEIRKLNDITGKHPLNLKIFLNENDYNTIINARVAFFNSIYELFFRTVPENICKSIEESLNIKWIMAVALIDKNELVSSALVMGDDSQEKPDREELLAFGTITANAIKRKRAEDSIRKNKEFFKTISGVLADYIYSVRIQPDGSIIRNFSLGNISELLGYQPKENSVVDVWTNLIIPDDIPLFYEKMKSGFDGEKSKFEVRINTKSNELKHLLGYIIPIIDEIEKKVTLVFAAFQDITEAKQSEKKIKSLLSEKELVLKEVHHRIKNNMETIKNLLFLQADKLDEKSAAIALHDAGNRVQSMMLLYDKLYKSDNFGVISFSSYCSTLVHETVSNFPNSDQVTIINMIDDFVLDPKKIQPLGMIINELITNIMKHAITGTDYGIIRILGILRDNTVCLIIHDNCNKMPEHIDIENSTGFGLMLVKMLTKQLEGDIHIQSDNGLKVTLNFKR